MYFLFTVLLTASFLIKAEFSAVCFSAELILTALYLYLFTLYFKHYKKILSFIPVVLLSLSMHITFFLQELHQSYIKDINFWLLAVLLITVSGLIAFGMSSKSGITAFAHMCTPLFFITIVLGGIGSVTGKIVTAPVIGSNIYQYYFTAISPLSVSLTLIYLHNCRYRKIFTSFFSATVIAVFFFLFDSPFFQSVVINFSAPMLIAAEMSVIKEAILPRKDFLDKNA